MKEGNARVDNTEQDQPFHFVERCKETAVRAANLGIVKELVANTLVRRVVQPDAEKDEADIYVLSVAIELQRAGQTVGVLTQERADKSAKLSMNTACGLLGLVCLRMEAFLHQEGIWTWT